ncbi:MAG: hypothetical protein EAX95_08420 [Candidatus Thorarchaeota archaeon]|nr:hypothetical protein [Candidatus Thorarchaeota archaeon]
MYVKIRQDGAIGIGRATEGQAEITMGYGEAHMIAAALEKLAQTARSYKQVYHKTTDVGGGNRIEFERSDDGTIAISGDRQFYFCTEKEVRDLAEKLKHLPPVEVAPPSDYAQKVTPNNGFCINVTNGGQTIRLKLADAALVKTAVQSSVNGRFYDEVIVLGERKVHVSRSSDLKWGLGDGNSTVRFTAYEVEALIAGLHNAILDVLMDMVKSLGSDDLADIRVKSQIQRIEQESTKLLAEYAKGKGITKSLLKSARKILGKGMDADSRTDEFIDVCRYVLGEVDPRYQAAILELLSSTFAGAT